MSQKTEIDALLAKKEKAMSQQTVDK